AAAQRAHHQVVLAVRDAARSLAGDLDLHGAGGRLDAQLIAQVQGEAERVVAGAEVRGGRRDLHRHARVLDPHRPMASAAAWTSTGTTVGVRSCRVSAVSMSFSPLPVTVIVMVASEGTRPRADCWSRPATPAAEAGSTKMPTSPASSFCASRIWSSLTASMRPPELSRASTARCQEAGAPMRIAVATVSGFAIGWPATKGA